MHSFVSSHNAVMWALLVRGRMARWGDFERESRLTAIGLLSGSVLGMIGLVFGLLKVDTATKGYYSKRLFLGVPAAIIGLFALAVAFGHLKH